MSGYEIIIEDENEDGTFTEVGRLPFAGPSLLSREGRAALRQIEDIAGVVADSDTEDAPQ